MRRAGIDYADVVLAGLSALQCAAVALKHTVQQLELCESAGQVKLHSLRKEQMMETLECLLQMESYLHAPVRVCSFSPIISVASEQFKYLKNEHAVF